MNVYNKEIKISGESEVSLDLTDLKNSELYDEILNGIRLGVDGFSDKKGISYGGVSIILMGVLIGGMDIGQAYGIF